VAFDADEFAFSARHLARRRTEVADPAHRCWRDGDGSALTMLVVSRGAP
jgi:hypothetical protein